MAVRYRVPYPPPPVVPPLGPAVQKAFDPWRVKENGKPLTLSGIAKTEAEHRQTGGYHRIPLDAGIR